MKIFFLGSEVPSNRKLLLEQGVKNFGFSYYRAFKRGFPKTKVFSLHDYFPEDASIILHPGISEMKDLDQREVEEIAADYQDFVVTHLDNLTSFVEFDAPQMGDAWLESQRAFWSQAEEKFWPIWKPERSMENSWIWLRISLRSPWVRTTRTPTRLPGR